MLQNKVGKYIYSIKLACLMFYALTTINTYAYVRLCHFVSVHVGKFSALHF